MNAPEDHRIHTSTSGINSKLRLLMVAYAGRPEVLQSLREAGEMRFRGFTYLLEGEFLVACIDAAESDVAKASASDRGRWAERDRERGLVPL